MITSPKKSDPFEAELDTIRLAFYEETKSMSPVERNAYIRAQGARSKSNLIFGLQDFLLSSIQPTSKAILWGCIRG